MKELTDLLTVFFNIFRSDIFEYFKKSYSYLKDLIEYKRINLNKKIDNENEDQVKSTLEQILKSIKTGLNTIGIPIEQVNANQKDFIETFSMQRGQVSDYNSLFVLYLQKYVNNLLFDIILDYLLNIDKKKLENVNLFDLLPPYFISKLNEFKRIHFNYVETIQIFKKYNYKNVIDFSDLTIIKPEERLRDSILSQLREAKEISIETLKTPREEVLKHSIETVKNDLTLSEQSSQIKVSKDKLEIEQGLKLVQNTNTFIDYFGNFLLIDPIIVNKIHLDKLNLINLKVVNSEY
ncbi:MAG: hypothetical protein ACFFE5_09990, partial [Candidatus Thorarchaeota archaeon]